MIAQIIQGAWITGALVSIALRPVAKGWELKLGFNDLPTAYAFAQPLSVGRGAKVYKAADDYAIVSLPVQVASERPHPLATQQWELAGMSRADAQWTLDLYRSL